MMSLPDEQNAASNLVHGVCEPLRKARERNEKTIEEVAKALCLEPATVSAMEACDFSKLPEPIYVRGYIRNYARILGVDAEPLIRAYDDRAKSENVGNVNITEVSVVKGLRKKIVPPQVQWAAAGIIVIAIMLFVWQPWRVQEQQPPQQAPAAESKPETPMPLPLPPQAQGPGEVQGAPGIALPLPARPGAAAEQPVEMAPPQETPAPQSGVELSLSATADSWVEVSDATGKRVIHDMLKAGKTRTVRGVAPFRVLLGYAGGIQITYNGQPYDHSGFIRRDTARFELGQSADNQPQPGN